MKKLGLGPKMILSFLVAIAGSVVICGVITYSRTKNVLNSNMQLTSEQTLESALNSLQTYEKTISLPVDLLTRKTSIKQLEYEDQFDDYIANVQDELVAACKVTQGAVRSYYATSSGKLITGWVKYEDNGDKTAMNTIEENVDLAGEDWYVNCQGRKAKVNSIFSYITQPYEDPQTGGQIFTVAQEVKYKDVLMGVVAMDIDAAQLENYIRNIRILNTGFAMLIDADGNIVIDSDKNTFADGNVTGLEFWTPISGELKSLEEQKSALEEAGDESASDITLESVYTMRADGMDCAVTATTDQVTGWILLGCISDVENTGNLAKINGALVFAGAFGVIFGIVIALITAYSLVREIKKIERATAAVAEGDFTQTIAVTRGDEFGALETHFNDMVKDVSTVIREVEDKSRHILETSDHISEIAGDTRSTMGQVAEAISSVADGAVKQAESTQEASSEVDNLKNSLESSRDCVSEINQMTDLWFDYIPVRIRGGRKYERLYLFIRYKSAQEMDAVRQLHAQKSARNEEVPRRRRTRKTTEPERSAAAVSVAEPLGDELFTMTVTRAVRVLESRARSQTLQEKISPELYSAVSSVLVYTARLLTNTNSERRAKQAQETRDALNRILAQQHDLTCWALGMARMMLTKKEHGQLKSPQYNATIVYNAMEDITIIPSGRDELRSAGATDHFKADLSVFDE